MLVIFRTDGTKENKKKGFTVLKEYRKREERVSERERKRERGREG